MAFRPPARSPTPHPALRLAIAAGFLGPILVFGCRDIVGPEPEPEIRPVLVLEAGEITRGSLEAGDTAVYRLDAPAERPLRLFLLAETDTLIAQLVDDTPGSGLVWELLRRTPSDTSLTADGSSWFSIGPDRSFHIRVLGAGPTDGGAYTLFLYTPDLAPESVPAQVALGDTVAGESIAPPGDIDDFYFSAGGEQEVVVFFESLTATPLSLLLSDSATGSQLARVTSPGEEEVLERRSTGRLILQDAATYRLRVSGPDAGFEEAPYRFHLYPVDRRPQSVPAVVETGDTVTGAATLCSRASG
jgi:hypothetical protein